ncbi:MAG TPA: hypothetical protein VGF08_00605 [Terriglobales bacterium]
MIALVVLALAAVGYAIKHKIDHKYDAFAKCLAARNVVMYGAYWCPHCEEQKELFGASFEHVRYVECGIPGNNRGETQECKDAGVKLFPTWQFPPVGERHEGNLSLETLGDRSGCPLP